MKNNTKNIRKGITAVLFAVIMIASVLAIMPSAGANPVGTSDNGILVEEWRFDMHWYGWGWFGSSPAIANLGPDVNIVGTEPNSDLEIVTGSDECWGPGPSNGVWRAFDSGGNLEWQTGTHTDEARSSPAIADIDGDGDLEMAGGTTSGWFVQVLNHTGGFVWTFPKITVPSVGGPFVWPSSPAVADLDPSVNGLEVVIGNRNHENVWCFDGDNSDAMDDGVTITDANFSGYPYSLGTEGTDWDVLWIFDTGDSVVASPAIGDVDNDGHLEVVIGSTDGNVYVLDGATGSLEHTFSTGDAVYASAALADLDGDGYLEIVIGSTDSNVYCFEWTGSAGSTESGWPYTTSGPVYSSAAIGDVDGDGNLEIVVGSNDGNVSSLDTSGSLDWSYATGGAVYSSPALANRGDCNPYAIEWQMFRHDAKRTGFYGPPNGELDIYVGSDDGYLYLISGDDGSIIDRFEVYTGPYPSPQGGIHTSPSVADVDGDKNLEIFFYDWGNDSSYSGHTFWALENRMIGKTFDPEEGGLGTEVHVTIDDVTVGAGQTVTVVDTLPSELSYITGTFTVDGVSATPTVTKQVISYTITNTGVETKTYTIEFDVKVTEASWEDVTVTNVVNDGTNAASADFTINAFEELQKETEDPLTIDENTETQWLLVINVTNPFGYTMNNTVITDRFGAEIEINEIGDTTHGTASWDYGPGKKKPNKSKKVFLTWTVGDLLPGETAQLTLLVSTDLNPAGKQEYSTDGVYELNSGATLKFIDPDLDQLSAVTDSIYVTVLPLPPEED